jgi:hypothetical protein
MQEAYQGKSNKLLKQATAKQMLTLHQGSFGLGWMLQGHGKTLRFSHGGSDEGFECVLTASAETGQALAIMVNCNVDFNFFKEVEMAIVREFQWPQERGAGKE